MFCVFLRGPQTQRREYCVCQLRMRVWSRAWLWPRASFSSCQPYLPSPAACSSRWDAAARLRDHRCTIQSPKSSLSTGFLMCSARRTRTSAAECSSWRCPYNSVLSSCHSWSGRANRVSGGEEKSWGNERTEWGSCSLSWTKREARSL